MPTVYSQRKKNIFYSNPKQSKYFRIYLAKEVKHLYSENLEVLEKELIE